MVSMHVQTLPSRPFPNNQRGRRWRENIYWQTAMIRTPEMHTLLCSTQDTRYLAVLLKTRSKNGTTAKKSNKPISKLCRIRRIQDAYAYSRHFGNYGASGLRH